MRGRAARRRAARRRGGAAVVLVWAALAAAAATSRADESVVNSQHDLSVHGPGPIRAVREPEVCIFCHTPHNAQPQTPLWNRELRNLHYRIYESSTTDARIDQPTGSSKMCLSCHDGVLALGSVLSRPAPHPIVMNTRTIPPGPVGLTSDLTTDLSDDHPIGFRYDRSLARDDPQIVPAEIITRFLPLGPHAEVHCSTCHDPHDNHLGNFLRLTDRRSVICTTCHRMHGWQLSAHARSAARVTGRSVDPRERLPYGSVADNGCISCHKIHGATHRGRLLRFTREEENCLNCHDGSVAAFNILGEIRKSSSHRGDRRQGIHDPTEEPFGMRRHSECVDCHNPHAARAGALPRLRRVLQRVPAPGVFVAGLDINGSDVQPARFLYEICFRCHADSATRPRITSRRQIIETNTRLEFQPNNPSFHPVAARRRNPDVVSLIPPQRVGGLIGCDDCHNSNNARSFGGSGPDGPHGSIFAPLLVANYETADFTIESAAAYALCYRCHDRTSILSDESFSEHNRHVVLAQTPCSACHDAHGISWLRGNSVNHSNLINFDTTIVQPATGIAVPRIEYVDGGRRTGSCMLLCHGDNHVDRAY